MKRVLMLGLLLPGLGYQQGPAVPPLPADHSGDGLSEPQAEPAAPESWDGTFAQGMAEVVRLAASNQVVQALALSDRLLAPDRYQRWRADLEESSGLGARVVAALDGPLTWMGFEQLPARDRAEVRFARGLLSARQKAVLDADTELELTRSLAGPGELRQAAVYALGVLDLSNGERLRQEIPEISGQQPAPPGPPVPGAAPQEEPPDPLELARAAYEAARAHLVERVQLDWRDGDTRANLELVLRRLRELDEIERQREEQEQPDPPEQEPDPDQESEPSDEEPDDSESSEQEPSEDQEPSEEPEPEEGEEQEQSEDSPPPELEEEHMTAEEMKQLLEILKRHQEANEEIKDKLKGQGRSTAKRDW